MLSTFNEIGLFIFLCCFFGTVLLVFVTLTIGSFDADADDDETPDT